MSNLNKRISNLLTKLTIDEKSVFFTKGETLDNKTTKIFSKSSYVKNNVLLNLYNEFVKNGGKTSDFKDKKVVINTHFTQRKLVTQRGEMPHTIDGPMQLIQVNVADLNFFSKSVVASKYCLVCVGLFRSKTCTYSMKKKSHLPSKLGKFFSETERFKKYLKKEGRHQMRLQTDQEFNQNEIKEINKKYVLHYNSKLNNGHAVAAEQKIRELKNCLKNFKRLLKKGELKPNEALRKATANMNIFLTKKYGVPPEEAEKKSLEFEEHKLDYNFKWLKKVYKDAARYSRYDMKLDKKIRKKLRSPLNVGEIAFVLSARIKKKRVSFHFL